MSVSGPESLMLRSSYVRSSGPALFSAMLLKRRKRLQRRGRKPRPKGRLAQRSALTEKAQSFSLCVLHSPARDCTRNKVWFSEVCEWLKLTAAGCTLGSPLSPMAAS